MCVYSARDPSLTENVFAALTHRWRHLPHLFFGGALGWFGDGRIHHRKEPISSSFILVISLSTLPPPPPRLFWRTLELVPVACQWLATLTHIYTYRSEAMMIPNSRIDAIVPQRSPTTYLCFVKYRNDSINIKNNVSRKLLFFPSIQTTLFSV